MPAKSTLFIILLCSIILILICVFLYKIKNCTPRLPIDEPINLNACYLIVHNFVNLKNNSYKTYVNTYSSPYLIELLQNNVTQDCICCQ